MTKKTSVDINLRIDEAAAALNTSRRDIFTRLAQQGEAHAKANMEHNGTIDTGFAINSIIGLGPGASSQGGASTTAKDKKGRTVRRESVATPDVDDDSAAVAVGANYAIWIELRSPFLGPISDQLKNDLDSIVAANKVE